MAQSLGRIAGDFFSSILLFRFAPAQRQVDQAALRSQVLASLDAFSKHPDIAAYPADEVEEARFALVAWADEMVLKTSWPGREQWERDLLQLQFYRTNRAGNEFYDHLARLRPEQTAAREVYFMCLALDFEGQWAGHEPEKRAIVQQQFEMLRATGRAADVASTNPIAPPAYDVAIELKSRSAGGMLRIFLGWGAVAVAIFAGLYFALGWAAGRVPLPPGS